MIEFAEALTMTPVTVSADLRARLDAGLTERQQVALANLIAWENARARFNRGFGIDPDHYAG